MIIEYFPKLKAGVSKLPKVVLVLMGSGSESQKDRLKP
jgi:hypothetical protein